MSDPDAALTRARRSLRGLSVGDAFGETFFGSPRSIELRLEHRALRERTPWGWTDDTAMALSIVEVLARCGHIDPDLLAEAFARRWSAQPDRGYGGGAHRLLQQLALGAAWRPAAAALFDGQGSMGNGGAMRSAPIGAYFCDDLDRVVAEAARSAEPTHAHREGVAGAIAIAVAAALATRRGQGATLDGAALFAEVVARTPDGATRAGLLDAAALLATGDPLHVAACVGSGRRVLASDTVPFCVWAAARHLDSYEEALWTAVAPPGDRDTNAAIVGGIVVMAVDAIPPAWLAATEPLPA